MEKRNVILLTLFLITLLPLTSSYEFCEDTISEDQLEIKEIKDISQTSDTNWSWKPSDTIDVQVKVMNKNFTTRNFRVELFFLDDDFDPRNITVANKNPVKTISIAEDETETINFTFELDEPKYSLYYLYAKATDTNNETICTSLRATSKNEEADISIIPEEKIVLVRKVDGPTSINPGERVEYKVEIINLGNKREERVLAIMFNEKLKIREEIEIVVLSVEQTKTVKFNFTLPENTTIKDETLLFSTEYDYRNETGFYYQSANKAKPFNIQINTTNEPSIEVNQTQNQATQNPKITENQSNSQPEEKEKPPRKPIPYLWPILITVSIITIIITIIASTFLFLRKRRDRYITSTGAPTAASEYVKKIQEESKV